MWCRELLTVWLVAFTVVATQSHAIQKRGLLSKLFGSKSKTTADVESGLPSSDRLKLKELLKNPVVVSMLTAAVGVAIQQALAAKKMNDICENKFVQMARGAGVLNPQLQQAINLLGCNGANRKFSDSKSNNKYNKATTPAYNDEEENADEEQPNDQDENKDAEDTLESGIPPEQHSKLQQLMGIARGEKGAKRNFIKGLFGLSKKDKTFKKGHKLPSSSYKLDKDDADAMTSLEKELEKFNKSI